MKEYVDRNEFLKRFNVLYNVLDNLERMLYSDALVKLIDMPVADVIEREKIDKAIEEMSKIDLNEYADNTYQLVNKCIEILKRNVEENK